MCLLRSKLLSLSLTLTASFCRGRTQLLRFGFEAKAKKGGGLHTRGLSIHAVRFEPGCFPHMWFHVSIGSMKQGVKDKAGY